jgi:hypothetical protein
VLLRDERLRGQYGAARNKMERGEMELSPWQPIMEAKGLAYASLAYELDY